MPWNNAFSHACAGSHQNVMVCVTGVLNSGIILFLWWRGTVLPHPLYIPDLVPSNLRKFGALKDAILGKSFETDDEVTEEVASSSEFKLMQRGDTCSGLSLVRFCSVWWRWCSKMRCVISPSSYLMSMFKEITVNVEQ